MVAMKTDVDVRPDAQGLVITTTFDAPMELVYKTLTDPDLVPEWWGPRELETTVEKMEVKPGGLWRYIHHAADGSEFAFNGVYHAVQAPERLVYTMEFEGMPGHVSLESVELEEMDGKTVVTDTVIFQSVEDRDATLQADMERGARESMERFGDLLSKQKQRQN